MKQRKSKLKVNRKAKLQSAKALFTIAVSLNMVLQPVFYNPAYAQQIILDPSGNVGFSPQVKQPTNAKPAPTVNIVKPKKGVSHNKYKKLNVDKNGIVLNNSKSTSTTKLNGTIEGNPNLVDGTADIIINEVTGTETSSINGVTEVAGDKADVIYANPNGVGCDGCAFVNTGTATLTTGVPVVSGQDVTLDVRTGAVSIGEGGLSGADNTNLVGRSVVVNGKVVATEKITVSGGAQKFQLKDGTVIQQAGTGNTPAYAVDGKAFGAMQAGQIEIIGTEAGLGVRVDGALTTTQGNLTVKSAQDVKIRSGQVKGSALISAPQGKAVIERDLSSKGKTIVKAKTFSSPETAGLYGTQGVELYIDGVASISGEIQTPAPVLFEGEDIFFDGFIQTGGSFTLNASNDAALEDATLVADVINLWAGNELGLFETYLAANSIDVDTYDFHLGSNVIVNGPETVNVDIDGDFINSTDYFAQDDFNVKFKGSLINTEAGVLNKDDLVLVVGGRIENAGTIYGKNNLSLTSAGIVNTGKIGSEQTLSLQVDFISNSDMISADTLHITSEDFVENSEFGKILADSRLEITTSSVDNVGLLYAGDEFLLTAKENLTNTGTIASDGVLDVEAETFSNIGIVQANDKMTLLSQKAFSNSGKIVADTILLDLQGEETSINHETSLIAAKSDLHLKAHSFENYGGISALKLLTIDNLDAFTNTGLVVSERDLVVSTKNFTNFGIIQAEQNSRVSVESFSNTGQLISGNSLFLDADEINNSGTVTAITDATITTGSFLNSGQIGANGTTSIIAPLFYNTGTIFGNKTLSIESSNTVVNAGKLYSDGVIGIDGGAVFKNMSSGLIFGEDKVFVEATMRIENAGSILSNGSLDILTPVLLNKYSGQIVTQYFNAEIDEFLNEGQVRVEDTLILDLVSFQHAGILHVGKDIEISSQDMTTYEGSQILSGYDFTSETFGESGTLKLSADRGKFQGVIGAASAQITAEDFVHSGVMVVKQTANLSGGKIENSGQILADEINIEASDLLTNQVEGKIQTLSAMGINAQDLHNAGEILSLSTLEVKLGDTLLNTGSIGASENANFTLATLENETNASLWSGGELKIEASNGVVNDGAIQSISTLDIDALSDFKASGSTYSDGNFSISGQNITLSSTALTGGKNIILTASADLINSGTLLAIEDAKLDAGASLAQLGDFASGGKSIWRSEGSLTTGKESLTVIGLDALAPSSGLLPEDFSAEATEIIFDGILVGGGNAFLSADTSTRIDGQFDIANRLQVNSDLFKISEGALADIGSFESASTLKEMQIDGLFSAKDDIKLSLEDFTQNGVFTGKGAIKIEARHINYGSDALTIAGYDAQKGTINIIDLDKGAPLSIVGESSLELQGAFYSGGSTDIKAQDITDSALIFSNSNVDLTAISSLTLTEDSITLSQGNTELNGANFVSILGVVDAKDKLTFHSDINDITIGSTGVVSGESVAFNQSGFLKNYGLIGALGTLEVNGSEFINFEGAVVKSDAVAFNADEFSNQTGAAVWGNTLEFSASTILNSGDILANSKVVFDTNNLNNSGLVLSLDRMDLTSDYFINSGNIEAQNEIKVLAEKGFANSGVLNSLGITSLTLNTGDLYTIGEIIGYEVAVDVVAGDLYADENSLRARDSLAVKADNLHYLEGATALSFNGWSVSNVVANNTLTGDVGGFLGAAKSAGKLDLTVRNGSLTVNAGDQLTHSGDLLLTLGGPIINKGHIQAKGDLFLTSLNGGITNEQAVIKSGGDMEFHTKGDLTNISGVIESDGNMLLDVANVENRYFTSNSTETSFEQMKLTGSFSASGFSYRESNSGEEIYDSASKSGNFDLEIVGYTPENYVLYSRDFYFATSSLQQYEEEKKVDALFSWSSTTTTELEGASPIIRSGGNINLDVEEEFENNAGSISAQGDITGSAGSIFNAGGENTTSYYKQSYSYESKARYSVTGSGVKYISGSSTGHVFGDVIVDGSVGYGQTSPAKIVAGGDIAVQGMNDLEHRGLIKGSSVDLEAEIITAGVESYDFIEQNINSGTEIDLSDFLNLASVYSTGDLTEAISVGDTSLSLDRFDAVRTQSDILNKNGIDRVVAALDLVGETPDDLVEPPIELTIDETLSTDNKIDPDSITYDAFSSSFADYKANTQNYSANPNLKYLLNDRIDGSGLQALMGNDKASLYTLGYLDFETDLDKTLAFLNAQKVNSDQLGFSNAAFANLNGSGSNPDTIAGYNGPNYSYDQFLTDLGLSGADYSFGYNPAIEAEALRLAVLSQTGSEYFYNEWSSAEEQHYQLAQNAIAFSKNWPDAEIGVPLTEAQIASLKAPLVWYVYQKIDGKQVLVPRLYTSDRELTRAPPGAIIADDKIVLNGNTVTIYGTDIQSKESDVAIYASDNLNIHSSIYTTTDKNNVNQTRNASANISAGNNIILGAPTPANLGALGKISISGARLDAQGNIAITGEDVALNAAYDFKSYTDNIGKFKENWYKVTSIPTSISAQTGGISIYASTGDITSVGTQFTSNNNINIKSEKGDIVLAASKDIYEYHSQEKGGGFLSKTLKTQDILEIQHNGTSFDIADGELNLIAGNDVITAGTAVNAQSNVNIDAGNDIYLGVYEDISIVKKHKSKKILMGLINISDSTTFELHDYQGTDIRTDGNLSLTAVDTTLVSSKIQAAELNINVEKLNFEFAVDYEKFTHSSTDDNGIIITTIDEGYEKETVDAIEISTNAPINYGDLTSDAIQIGRYDEMSGGHERLNSELPLLGSDNRLFTDSFNENSFFPTGDGEGDGESKSEDNKAKTEFDLLSLADTGNQFNYLTDLETMGVKIDPILLVDEQWYDKSTRLNPAFKALLMIAITQGMDSLGWLEGLKALGPISGAQVDAAAQAMFASLSSSTLDAVVSGDLDVELVLKDMLTSGVTAGVASYASQYIPSELFGESGALAPAGLNPEYFSPNAIVKGVGDQLVANVISDTIRGENPIENIDNEIALAFLQQGLAGLQNGIGSATEGNPIANFMLHVSLGCGGAMLSGSECRAGAAAAFAERIATSLGPDEPKISDFETAEQYKSAHDEWKDNTSKNAELLGAGFGYLVSGGNADNVYTTANISESITENNYLKHADIDQMVDDIKECFAQESGCSKADKRAIAQKYQKVSFDNDKELVETCFTDECIGKLLEDAITYDEAVSKIGAADTDVLGYLGPNPFFISKPAEQQLARNIDYTKGYLSYSEKRCVGLSSDACLAAYDESYNDYLSDIENVEKTKIFLGVITGGIFLGPELCAMHPTVCLGLGMADLSTCIGGDVTACAPGPNIKIQKNVAPNGRPGLPATQWDNWRPPAGYTRNADGTVTHTSTGQVYTPVRDSSGNVRTNSNGDPIFETENGTKAYTLLTKDATSGETIYVAPKGGATYRIGDSDGGPGAWTRANESMSDTERAYQQRVTGAPDGTTYNVPDPNVSSGRTSFDGYNPQTNTLIDAKCWTCWPNNSLSFSNQSVVDQAFRQQRIAQQTGRTVEWHVPDQAAATRVQNAFATAPDELRIDPNVIHIVVTPQ